MHYTIEMKKWIVFALLLIVVVSGCRSKKPENGGDIDENQQVEYKILIDAFSVSPLEGKAPLTIHATIVAHVAGQDYRGETGLIYRIDFDGDGKWDYEGNPCINVPFTYEKPGSYDLRAEVYDTQTGVVSDEQKRLIQVNENKPPVIESISVSPREGYLINGRFTIMLYVSAYDPDSSDGIARITYDMDGDGVVDYEKSHPSVLDLQWTYTRGGEYDIIVKVYDDDGAYAVGRALVRVFERAIPMSRSLDLDSYAYSVLVTGPFYDRSILPEDFQGYGLGPYYLVFLGESYGNVEVYYSASPDDLDSLYLLKRFKVNISYYSKGGVVSMTYRNKCLLIAGGAESAGEPYVAVGVSFSDGVTSPRVTDTNIFSGVNTTLQYSGSIVNGSYRGTPIVAAGWFSDRILGGGVNLTEFDFDSCQQTQGTIFDMTKQIKMCPFDIQSIFCSKVRDVAYYDDHLFIASDKYGLAVMSIDDIRKNCAQGGNCYAVYTDTACPVGYNCVKTDYIAAPPFDSYRGPPYMSYWIANSLSILKGGWVYDESLHFDEGENGLPQATVKYLAHVTAPTDAVLYRNGEVVPYQYWRFVDGKRIVIDPYFYYDDPWAWYTVSYKKATLLFVGMKAGETSPADHHSVPVMILDITNPDSPVLLNKDCLDIPAGQPGSCRLEAYKFSSGGVTFVERLFLSNIFVDWPFAFTFSGNLFWFLPVDDPYFPFASTLDWYHNNKLYVGVTDEWTDAGPISTSNQFMDVVVTPNYKYAANYSRGLSVIGKNYRIQREVNIGGIPEGFSYFKSFGRSYIFIAKGYGGVDLYDISDISNPDVVSHADIDGEAMSVYYDRSRGVLYVAGNNYGIYSFDFRNVHKPRLTGHWQPTYKIKLLDGDNNNFMFFCNDTELNPHLYVQHLGDDLAPTQLSVYCYRQGAPIYVSKDKSNFIAISGKLYSYDLSVPPRITYLASTIGDSQVVANYVEKDRFIIGSGKTVFIYDISTPTAPYQLSKIDLDDYLSADEIAEGGVIQDIDKEAQYLFVALGSVGLFVFDMSNPEAPELVGYQKGFSPTVMETFITQDRDDPGVFYYDAVLGSGEYSITDHKVNFVRFMDLSPPVY